MAARSPPRKIRSTSSIWSAASSSAARAVANHRPANLSTSPSPRRIRRNPRPPSKPRLRRRLFRRCLETSRQPAHCPLPCETNELEDHDPRQVGPRISRLAAAGWQNPLLRREDKGSERKPGCDSTASPVCTGGKVDYGRISESGTYV